MLKNKCRCGGKKFETVDVTPVGSAGKQYFTRCVSCGLVTAAVGFEGQVKRAAKGAGFSSRLKHAFRQIF